MRKLSFFVSIVAVLFVPQLSLAANPSVSVFTASQTSLLSGYSTTLSWNVANGAGADIMFLCPNGFAVKQNGTTVQCNVRQVVNASDSASYTITNVGGSPQSITVMLYPKDAQGVSYDAAAASVSITVAEEPNPITDASISPAVAQSYKPITVTWRGYLVPGVNLQFDCSPYLQFYQTGGSATTSIQCGNPAFTTDLQQTGSQSFIAVNTSNYAVDGSVRVVPDVISGTYETVHAKALSFNVAPAVNTAPANPAGLSFVSSDSSIIPGKPFTLTWNTSNAAGANIQFNCNSALSFFSISTTTGALTALPCSAPAFNAALAATGTTAFEILSNSYAGQNVTIQLLPQSSSGSYLALNAQTLMLPVLSMGTPTTTPASGIGLSVPMNSSTQGGTSSPSSGGAAAMPHAAFTIPLSRGAQNAQVTALQKFLAQNPVIYPEGTVSGYYGALTEKAVMRFQEKYNIAHQGTYGYGNVGPGTRAKLNTLTTP